MPLLTISAAASRASEGLVPELDATPAKRRRVQEKLEGPALAEPLREAGVAVGVGVDQAGQDQPIRRVHGGRVRRSVHAGRADGANRVAFDEEVGRAAAPTVAVQHAAAPDDDVGGGRTHLFACIHHGQVMDETRRGCRAGPRAIGDSPSHGFARRATGPFHAGRMKAPFPSGGGRMRARPRPPTA